MEWSECGDRYFDFCFTNDTLPYESEKLTNTSGDKGGWTKYGISQSAGYSEQFIKSLTLDQAKEIYKKKYWDVLGCAKMPAPLARHVFDWGVNAGTVRAMKLLQELIFSPMDGVWGTKTENDMKYYLSRRSLIDLYQAYAQRRANQYKSWSVGSQKKFRQGWLNRVNNLAEKTGVTIII